MSTGRRLWQYALLYKKSIIWALVLLALAVSAELAGPFLAKRMIDQNILGIEKPWYEATSADAAADRYAVPYGGSYFKREDRWSSGGSGSDGDGAAARGREVRVLQAGRDYYFIDQPVQQAEGERTFGADGMLTVNKDGAASSYPAAKLSRSELWNFYKPEFASMLKLAGAYFGLLLLGAVFAYGQRYLLQLSANKVIHRMRGDVFAHIQRLPVHYFDNLPAGKVVSRVTNDTEAVRELYVAVLANFFSGIVYITAILGALFLLDAKLALIALPMVPILIVWILVYRRIAGGYNAVIRSRLSDINAMINESIQGMPIIQAFRREKKMTEEFGELNQDFFKYQNKLLNLNSVTSHNLVNLIRNVLFLTVVWMFAGGSLGAYVTVGVLFAFIDYMNRMMNPIVGIVNQLSNLETARISAGRVFELLNEPGIEVAEADSPRYRGDVSFHDVSFAYKKGEDVLRNISFHAKQGQTVALVGHTGSGKSSMLNLLFRFYDTDRGVIAIDGTDIRQMPKQQLRKHMGIVLQDPFLFTGTIASNVSLGDPAISRERVEQALRDVGAYDMFMSLPNGLDEAVVEKGATLSAGQRQLISFARALAFDPAILILDEATASIDTETEAVIQRALDVLKRGRTTFVIAHRLSTIRAADQILVLDRGRIVERGNHDELMAHGGRYYAMYQLQQGGAAAPAPEAEAAVAGRIAGAEA